MRLQVDLTGHYRGPLGEQRRCAGPGCRAVCGRYDGGRADVFCRDCREQQSTDLTPAQRLAALRQRLAK